MAWGLRDFVPGSLQTLFYGLVKCSSSPAWKRKRVILSLLSSLFPLFSFLHSILPPLFSSLSTLNSSPSSLLSAVGGECRSFQQVPVVFEARPTAGPWSHWGFHNSKIPKIIRIYSKMDRRGYLARSQWPLDSWYLLCLLSMLQSHP